MTDLELVESLYGRRIRDTGLVPFEATKGVGSNGNPCFWIKARRRDKAEVGVQVDEITGIISVGNVKEEWTREAGIYW